MAKQGTILVVDDNKAVLNALEMLLAGVFREVITLRTPNQIEAILESGRVDVVLLDMNFSAGINTGNEGLYWLSRIKEYAAEIPVVLFTAYADIDLAVRAVKEGATDFVVKPWDNAKLVATLLAAYRLHESRREVKQLKAKEEVLKGQLSPERTVVWGESDVMRRVRQLIEKVAVTDANVLITGENGTGKEMLAREIHALSNRKYKEMIAVDMGTITESLFESELFGHIKGSFTDAHADRTGKFEAAEKSTLFLDEIGNLPYHLQAKLLTAIQRRSIVKVGSNTPIPIDIRLICATNRNLQEMVAKGEFREDLLYRINTIHVEIPPLRERKEDIIPLAERFMVHFCKQYDKGDIDGAIETRRYLIRKQDSLNNAFSANQLKQVKEIYHIDELLLEKQKIQDMNYRIGFIFLGVCLLLMLLFYLYTRYVSGKIAVIEKKTAEAALQAETDNIAKERLKSEISHDIRTPLNVVVGFAELLTGKEELDKETKREYGQMIQTNAESLLNYVNSILELSRLESGKIQYEDEECDIIQLCSEVLDKVNGREESTVSVSLQTDLKEQFARTDRRWFDTLLVSMLTPSENDTARYEAIIRIRRDRTRSALYFDVVNAPFAKVHFENKTSLIRHEINAHFIHYFGGIYKVQTEAEEGSTISFTIPC